MRLMFQCNMSKLLETAYQAQQLSNVIKRFYLW